MDSNCGLKVQVLVSERNERKLELLNFVKLLRDIQKYQSIIEFCKIIRKRFGEKFRLWISYNWGIEFTSLFGSFKRVFTSGGKKLCSINEYGDKIVVEVRACKQFKARFQDIRRFDPVGEKKKNVYIQLTRRVA